MNQRIQTLYAFSKTLDPVGKKFVLTYLLTLKAKRHIRKETIYTYIKQEFKNL